MFFGIIGMLILYVLLKYILAWIRYFNSQDERLGQSTWRWSYDYEVDGERDISDLDDKNFVRLRRKRNKIITLMYSVVLIMFILSMSLLSQILIFFLYLFFNCFLFFKYRKYAAISYPYLKIVNMTGNLKKLYKNLYFGIFFQT